MDEGVWLAVEEDVTAAVTERERRERRQRQLVTMLVRLVDRRDRTRPPFGSRRRRRAGDRDRDGTRPGGRRHRRNRRQADDLGKILVPSAVLTKPGALTDDELRQVRDSLQAVADVLEEVEFDGPVVATLRQLQERWDGSADPPASRATTS